MFHSGEQDDKFSRTAAGSDQITTIALCFLELCTSM